MSPVSPVLEEEHEDDTEEKLEDADERDSSKRDSSTKSLEEIIDTYAG